MWGAKNEGKKTKRKWIEARRKRQSSHTCWERQKEWEQKVSQTSMAWLNDALAATTPFTHTTTARIKLLNHKLTKWEPDGNGRCINSISIVKMRSATTNCFPKIEVAIIACVSWIIGIIGVAWRGYGNARVCPCANKTRRKKMNQNIPTTAQPATNEIKYATHTHARAERSHHAK